MAMPSHRNPCPEGHEIYNFDKNFHANHDSGDLKKYLMQMVKKVKDKGMR